MLARKTIVINNLRVSYVKENNPNQKNILFLHGFQSSLNSFQKLFSLKRNYNAVAFDFPSHGHTLDGKLLTQDYLLKFTQKFIAKLNLNFDMVVGHSLGGMVASFLPNINKKILIAPHSPFIFNYYNRTEFLKQISPNNFKEAQASLRSMVAPNFIDQNYLINLEQMAQRFLNSYRIKKQYYDPLISTYLTNENTKTLLPKLVQINSYVKSIEISGDQDNFVPWKATRDLAKAIHGKFILLKNVGHSPIYEKTQDVAQIITTFLNI